MAVKIKKKRTLNLTKHLMYGAIFKADLLTIQGDQLRNYIRGVIRREAKALEKEGNGEEIIAHNLYLIESENKEENLYHFQYWTNKERQ